jgi:hypothetical protein
MHASKIGDLPLFATVGALAAVWLMAVVGLSLTIKRDYRHTFVSLRKATFWTTKATTPSVSTSSS